MALPEHHNPTRPERAAVAPYNFVPLPDFPITYRDDERNPLRVDQGVYHEKRLTGWITVTLETVSPVYVRGPLTPADYETMERQEKDASDQTPHLQKLRNQPAFFHVGDPSRPVIPGSSLRGMIRAVVEILGHGKFGPVTDQPLVYRAVGDTSSHGEAYRQQLMDDVPGERNHYVPKFQGGYIRRQGRDWYIQPAETINGATYARIAHSQIPQRGLQRWEKCRNAYQIYVQSGLVEFQKVRGGFIHIKRANVIRAAAEPGAGLRRAALVESGAIFSKRSEAVIFAPDEQAEPIKIPDGFGADDERDLVTAYKDQLTPEQEKLLGRGGVLREEQPVFYLMENGRLLFFGHTQMFRLPYNRSPKGFLPAGLSDDGRMDLAEALFGTAHGQQAGRAGRVFVTDGVLGPEVKDPWLPDDPVVIPKILSGPKPTTFQHYLTQPRPDVPQGKGLETYNSSPAATTLRGYKLYWHKGKDLRRDDFAVEPETVTKDSQHTQIKPVRPGIHFHFRVYFENLLPVELGLLWWALQIPVKGDFCHKIGMGKPLGLGAVRLQPTLHLLDTGRRYQSLFNSDHSAWEEGERPAETAAELAQAAVADFERFVAVKSRRPEGTPLAEMPRVQMLLAMLRWPGPDAQLTRYMEIERADDRAKRGKRNEYKDRPVLPDPLHVR